MEFEKPAFWISHSSLKFPQMKNVKLWYEIHFYISGFFFSWSISSFCVSGILLWPLTSSPGGSKLEAALCPQVQPALVVTGLWCWAWAAHLSDCASWVILFGWSSWHFSFHRSNGLLIQLSYPQISSVSIPFQAPLSIPHYWTGF